MADDKERKLLEKFAAAEDLLSEAKAKGNSSEIEAAKAVLEEQRQLLRELKSNETKEESREKGVASEEIKAAKTEERAAKREERTAKTEEKIEKDKGKDEKKEEGRFKKILKATNSWKGGASAGRLIDKTIYILTWPVRLLWNLFVFLGVYFLLIFLIIFLSNWFGAYLYGNQATKCVDYIKDPAVPGLAGSYFTFNGVYFKNPGLFSCVFSQWFKPIQINFKNFGITKKIAELMDEQIYAATNEYYFTKVDENAEEVGVFIENFDIENEYYADQAISVMVDLKVKTLGDTISGSAVCDINNAPVDLMYPDNGRFTADKTTMATLGCVFDKNRFDAGTKALKFTAQFKFNNFAYMVPTFIKRSVYKGMTPTQKQDVESKAGENILKTSNTPVKIGGRIGAEDSNLIIIEDNPILTNTDTSTTEGNGVASSVSFDVIQNIKFGIMFESNSWTSTGKVREMDKVVIILPTALQLSTEKNKGNDEIESCGGYTFKIGENCNGLKEYLGTDDYDYICSSGQTAYMLDQSGSNAKINEFDTTKTIHCWLKSNREELFKDDNGNDVGVRALAAKIFSTYKYEISESKSLNIVKKIQVGYSRLSKEECSESLLYSIGKPYDIATDTISNYADRFQGKVKGYTKKEAYLPTGFDKVQIEALVAAISKKYSGFNVTSKEQDKNNNGILDYLTGCWKLKDPNNVMMDNHDADIMCLLDFFKPKLDANKDIKAALDEYYKSRTSEDGTSNTYSEEKKATIEDYHAWIKILCKDKTNIYNTASPTATATATALKDNYDICGEKTECECTKNEECKSANCKPQDISGNSKKYCYPCAETGSSTGVQCDTGYSCNNQICVRT
jgi:hypothetical protein